MTEVQADRSAAAAAGRADALMRFEEARAAVLAAIPGPVGDIERLPPSAALGRVVAETAVATVDLPPWDNSAMDGYAIVAADTGAASEAEPVRLRVTGEAAAGSASATRVRSGEAIRIATGAPIPPGADAVVPVEQTTPVTGDGGRGARGRDATGPLPDSILVHARIPGGGSVRARGSDLRAGLTLAAPGDAVGPALVGLLAGAGVAAVAVHRRPRVAVLATGDEVRAAGEPLGPAGLPDANGPGLRALAAAAGAEVVDLGIARDDVGDVLERLRLAIATADAVIVSGGVSVGPYDVVRLAFDAIGRIDLWRVAVQPGKPFAFGLADRSDGPPVPLFGLPGNPVSSFVTFELFVRPAIRALAGRHEVLRPVDRAVILDPARTSAGRRAFLRVLAERDPAGGPRRDEHGRVLVHLAGGQGSHVLSALAAADALAVVPEDVEAAAPGDELELWWLDRA